MNKRHNSHPKGGRPDPGGMGGRPGGTVSMPNRTANWPKPKGKQGRESLNKVGFKHIKHLDET